jgi:hypothetical protein
MGVLVSAAPNFYAVLQTDLVTYNYYYFGINTTEKHETCLSITQLTYNSPTDLSVRTKKLRIK